MGKQDLLLEIGLEEMPAQVVQKAREQLQAKVAAWLTEQALSYKEITTYATPRRLAVLVYDLAEKQADWQEEAKGPARKIAVDEAGNWSKAAQGFARSQGVEVGELTFKEIKGVEYVHVVKEIKGKAALELLPQLRELITGLTFPKNMRWGTHELRFVRPIKWLVVLFGTTIIPIEITGIHSGRETVGHRFLGGGITLAEPRNYAEQLREQYVLVDIEERRQLIIQQLRDLEKEHGWHIPIDEELLAEVTQLVEYPTAIYGLFAEEFLEIPSEVLITSMKEHQRYFPVLDKNGSLLPYFVTIRNGLADSEGLVARGNEKVIRARLADARFFYEEDKKMSLDEALARLDNIVFHEELGSIGDKVSRVRELAQSLALVLGIEKAVADQLDRAAEICKFDLVSLMVGEFPELQGIMGEKYALLSGEDELVSQAVREHYLPRFAGDDLPQTELSSLLSVADKIDTIAGCFGIGIHPTGSQDPYALRRQAIGVVQIMLAEEWALTLEELFKLALDVLSKRELLKENRQKVSKDLEQFFYLRLKNRLQEEGIGYDLVEAVLNKYQQTKLSAIFAKAHVLLQKRGQERFKPVVEALTRVSNLATKRGQEVAEIEVKLFEKEIEQQLLEAYGIVKDKFALYSQEDNWALAYQALSELQKPIEDYFEQIMVMVEDEQVRQNRLALLYKIAQLGESFADFSQIVFPSK